MARFANGAGAELGAAILFVLLALALIEGITISIIKVIAADMAGGVRELQAGQVFNIAQAGVHYAIGKLQLAGGPSYTGETITVMNGATTLGTASVTVNCPDTGADPPCGGPYAAYRRIISHGTLPVSGPSRTIVAVVQATAGGPTGICAYAGGVDIGGATTVYSNVGSNAAIILAGGTSFGQIRASQNPPQQFKGTAAAMGSIACGSSCTAQIQGGIFPSLSDRVCPPVTSPTYSGGSANLYVDSGGFTMNGGTGYSWKDVHIAPGSCSGPTPFTDLNLQADLSNPDVTTVVQINTLVMGNCSRVVVLGVGKIELRIAKPGHNSLIAFANARFGVLPSDTLSAPAPVPASRFVVWVNSNGWAGATTAVQFINTQLVAGTILVPNGRIYSAGVPIMTGALWAYSVSFNAADTFTSDTSGLPAIVTVPYAIFNQVRSWKDE